MEENQSLLDLEVDREASTNILEASRWGKFMSIMILTALGLFVLLFAFAWNRISEQLFTTEEYRSSEAQMGVGIGVIIAIAVLVIVCTILFSFLIKGANRIRLGIQNRDQFLFNSGLASLKNYFAMYAVLGIILLFLSVVGLLTQ